VTGTPGPDSMTMLSDRALIRLSGDDVRGFLQGLVTNNLLSNLPVWAGLLTPQGKALFDFLVWADGEDLLIDCEANADFGRPLVARQHTRRR
jgi:tRNA-modifying protein YgfZ